MRHNQAHIQGGRNPEKQATKGSATGSMPDRRLACIGLAGWPEVSIAPVAPVSLTVALD